MSATPKPPVGYRPAHPMPSEAETLVDLASPATASEPAVTARRRIGRRDSAPVAAKPVRDATPAPSPAPSRRPAKTVAAKNRRTDRLSAFSTRFRRGTKPATDEASRDVELVDFDVPRIGEKPSVGKSRQAMMRLGIPVAGLVAIGGLALSCGVDIGSSRIPAAGAISQDEAVKFRLSSFPAEQAAMFGERYLEICLTQPPPTDSAGARARLDLLTQMATSGTDAGCGYSGTVTATANAPRSIDFTGTMRSLKGYDQGAAAFLTFQVSWSDDRLLNAVLPVWVDNRENPTAMRVVGNVGFMPVNKLGAPPAYADTRTKDSNLAGKLQQSVLQPFLTAWGSSDAQQLGLVLSDDATFDSRAGLRGVLTDPTVTSTVVFTSRTAEGSQIQYADGDEVIAQTAVQWFNSIATAKQSAAYQIRLRLVQGKWSVVDITGSALDPTGGPAHTDTTASNSTRTSTPTTTSSTPTTTARPIDPGAPTLPPANDN